MAPAPSRNISFVSHTDMNGHADGVQIMVHRGYAYVGHGFSNGITTLDVRDAKNPKVVDFIACPPGTRALHLQTHDDLLLAVNAPSVWHMQQFQTDKAYFGGSWAEQMKATGNTFTPGIRVYDISKPEKPTEIGFMPVEGVGPHRIWYVGGRYAYASIHFHDFTDHILAIIDMADPTQAARGRPLLAARHVARRRREPDLAVEPALRAASRARRRRPRLRRLARRRPDRDRLADPTKPRILAHRNTDPPFGGGTHSPLPLPDRNLLVVADEPIDQQLRRRPALHLGV